MKKYLGKYRAFTMSEVTVTMAVLGLLAIMCVALIRIFNPTEKGWQTMAKKMAENIEDATTEIMVRNASLDDFLKIKDGQNRYFSIEDSDAAARMAKLYQKYMSNIVMGVDTSKEYFTQPVRDYNKSSLGFSLKDRYSEFFFVADGVLMGLKFYGSCNSEEPYANPPGHRGKFSVSEICGSAFFDVNAYKKPNKLGSDQYVLPIYKRGIKYSND